MTWTRALLFLQYTETSDTGPGRSRRLTDDIISKRISIESQMRVLNQRGTQERVQ